MGHKHTRLRPSSNGHSSTQPATEDKAPSQPDTAVQTPVKTTSESQNMALPLAGKVAIVTGSSRGIGASIAKRLASDGASVVVNYFGSAGAAEEVVKSIHAEGHGKAVAIKADVSSIPASTKLIDETVQHFGKLDLLVLNAGLMNNGALDALDEKSFDDHFNINVKVPLFMVKEAAKHLKSGTCMRAYMHVT